ncbi:MAG: DUF1059 domain-containing protein [Actinobacteria bacterium]|jgi:hypothetical protein|nr:MAG: DUF1059 domain-containing protein [Actinomycetota bacterium]
MARKMIDCRDFPSDTGCTLCISGTEMEVLQASAEHAVSVHLHVDGPELRTQLLSMMKPE